MHNILHRQHYKDLCCTFLKLLIYAYLKIKIDVCRSVEIDLYKSHLFIFKNAFTFLNIIEQQAIRIFIPLCKISICIA